MSTFRSLRVAALALLCCLLGAAVGRPTTIEVTTATDTDVADADCSLREAIVAANDDAAYNGCPAGSGADRIVFSLTLPATIALASDLPTITSTLAIQGPGADLFAIDGQDLRQLLLLDSSAGGEWLGVEDLTLTRGSATNLGGGARIAIGDHGYFRRVHFLANRAANGGGGLVVQANASSPAVVGVDECWFEGNFALGAVGGGGLYVTGQLALVLVDRTTFSGNHAQGASGSGGAIRLTDGALTIERSTLSGNLANSNGGAFFLQSTGASGSLTLRDSTVTLNQADADGNTLGEGGGLYGSINVGLDLTLDLTNTILAGNLDSGVLTHPDVSVPPTASLLLVSQGFNLVGSNEGGSAFFVAGLPNGDGDWIGTSGAPIDPLLDPLALDGGFGPTHRPTADLATPVIDQGLCTGSGSDQRGYGDAVGHVRIVDTIAPNGAGSDGCDIGAYERGGDPQADPLLFQDDFEAGHPLYWSAHLP